MVGTDGRGCTWVLPDSAVKDLDALPAEGAGLLGEIMQRYSEGSALPREAKSLGKGLWELKGTIERNEYRLVFALHGAQAVALVAFGKKTQKLPSRLRKLAVKRNRAWERESE